MFCPHCLTAIKVEWRSTQVFGLDEPERDQYQIDWSTCPKCERPIVRLLEGQVEQEDYQLGTYGILHPNIIQTIYPQSKSVYSSEFVSENLRDDFEEARKVLNISPKSSAALTRRILQDLLHNHYGIKEKNLSTEIKKFIELPGLPSHIIEAVDAVRQVGNLAAHPKKDTQTDSLVEVEKGEAEWLVEVIATLFDFTFVQPKILEKRKKELQLKLEKIKK